MDTRTGEMKEFSDGDMIPDNFKPLPKVREVLDIRGCKFLVESYDVVDRKMVLRGLSNAEAKRILMENSNRG